MKPFVQNRLHCLSDIKFSYPGLPSCIMVFIFIALMLNGCDVAATPDIVNNGILMETPLLAPPPCEACAQATLAVILTQEKGNADFQAAVTAEFLRANAQATLNSAMITLSAAQTQEKNNNNIIAAQIAATAEVVRANAQATLNSASSTQIAAMTQAQYNLLATDSARMQSIIADQTQQNKDDLGDMTQTAIANGIATQARSAAATLQWYADQERQRNEERQGPITLLWTWCPLVFVIILACLILWGFIRWLNIQQANQRILEYPVQPAVTVQPHRHDGTVSYIDNEVHDVASYQVTTPEDKVHQWLDEVKEELSDSDEKEKDDDQGS